MAAHLTPRSAPARPDPARPGPRSEGVRSLLGRLATAVVVGGLLAGGAVVLAASLASSVHSRYLPWITGRSLGIASYVCLWALVILGTAMRHPWRARLRHPHPESLLRAHAVLGTATVVLVVAHVGVLASDRYAGVGWVGAIVPGLSHYRAGAVTLGVLAMVLLALVAVTARLAGRRGARHWLAFHRLATATFVLAWLHGVLAGTDTGSLRPVYLATAATTVALATTRALASTPRRRRLERLP